MLQMGGEKMAKSVGNITSLADALAEHGRDAVIMFFVAGHYRQPIQFDDDDDGPGGGQRAARARGRAAPGARALAGRPRAEHKERFFAALADDFNTPTALAERVRVDPRGQPPRARHRRRRPARDARRSSRSTTCSTPRRADGEPDAAALALLERREAARAARDFAEADRLRDELAAQGWQVRDSADGPQLVRVDP